MYIFENFMLLEGPKKISKSFSLTFKAGGKLRSSQQLSEEDEHDIYNVIIYIGKLTTFQKVGDSSCSSKTLYNDPIRFENSILLCEIFDIGHL